jgi:hypothetical protein
VTPRAGAVAVGPTGVTYLLLRPSTPAETLDPGAPPCWTCVTLLAGRLGSPEEEARLCVVREEWLLEAAREPYL